ncbi:hypothetical protein C9994_12795 [Marivirga lumbricoides]|uniref:Mannosyltransferase n=1 Tax=Marivirga lumbricoides TaxID=1046115 RepID=A0A2T4DIX6_9BACT|nr:hypothetical protein C9994_12795 [Marivirga lumbricoides]
MRILPKIAFLLLGTLFITISYFTKRHESLLLLSQYGLLFGLYLLISNAKENFTINYITGFAIVFRLSLLLLVPNLSEDVFRFIWDGKMWLNGLDSYAMLPFEAVNLGYSDLSQPLFNKLNSPEYYTIYPPVNQLIFYIAAFANTTLGSIIIIRLFILLAEVGTLILLPKVLKQYDLNPKYVIWYALNPLVVLELSGNLHFEAFVIFFAVLAIFYFNQHKLKKSAIATGLAISFKLIPLILLWGYLKKIKLNYWVQYCLIAILIALFTLLPLFFSEVFNGIFTSSALYFKSFEFNASIYYLVREIGFWQKGYNIIAIAGPLMGILTAFSIILYNLLAKESTQLSERFLWTWLFYCLFATTLHPWYCLPLVAFGILSEYKFPIVWTFLIFFTYIGYTKSGFEENLWITFLEYILLFGFIVFEIIRKRKMVSLYHLK